ncbi:MBL fold metallo-hydrolase [Clostridium sp. E02]|uniref:MBL fold metallo-hydrolase n=1 Tax=Clostridium sp. E02 TaxID=2487134 RepID=UPI000F524CFD|nr:MBL fold metallo-hydrolase [Clostridium sp. E02]
MEIAKKGIDLINEIDGADLKKAEAAFWWMGQMGFIIKLGTKVLYLDVFLSEHPERRIPPLLKPEEVVNADYILGTHDHLDHIDRKAWHQMSKSSPNATFLVPAKLISSLSEELKIEKCRFQGVNENLTVSLNEGIKVTGIASAHEFLDQDPVTGEFPYLGFIIEGNGCRMYHSGDTCIYDGLYEKLKRFVPIHVMFLPINGRDATRYQSNIIGNMTYQEAVDLAGTIKPLLVVPAHYEMFLNNKENPENFTDYLKAKYKEQNYWIGNHGEMVHFIKN